MTTTTSSLHWLQPPRPYTGHRHIVSTVTTTTSSLHWPQPPHLYSGHHHVVPTLDTITTTTTTTASSTLLAMLCFPTSARPLCPSGASRLADGGRMDGTHEERLTDVDR